MATERNIRVSDADRDGVAAQLREHYAQGRLTQDELNERLDRTFASRTNLELAAVTADLPYMAPRGVLPSDRMHGGYSGSWGQSGRGWTGQDWTGPGRAGPGGNRGYGCRGGHHAGSVLGLAAVVCAFWCLLLLMGVFGFGLGSGPSLIVIIIGAFAVLRRLLGLGRRKTMPGRPRRRRW